MHLDDERIQRLLHDELGSAAAEIRLHLESCAACRELVDEAREDERRIFGLLSQVDHPRPVIDLGTGVARRDSAPATQLDRVSAPPAGIAVPSEDGLVIRLLAEGDGAVATIELTGDEEVVVRAVEGSATFTSDPRRLTVRSSGPVRLEIHIPRTAASVEVRSGSTQVFRKLARGPVSEAAPDSMGRYIIPLGSSPP
jgi:hypothetical protein